MRDSQKTIKLVNELMGFYFKTGAKEMDVNVKDGEREVIISIQAQIGDVGPDQLEKLDDLNTPREAQVEEYYWELAGENNQYQELTLVGMMIDKAEIDYKDEKLEITVFRKK
ncbi:hypothetical protein [Halonatronum saccharophilum]|uniref:hypothetical protein n=1 Tax=Halonatronum saccharophilum TaxID=150060 RepID=UPI0004B2204A|nr:hypothetical protein [Halonatronum saccharophilum]